MWLLRQAAYDYSCLMVRLPREIASKLLKWSKDNIDESNLYMNEKENIDGYEDDPHVTIKYGIHDKSPDKSKQLISEEPPVSLKLGKISLFRNDDKPYDVVKIDVISEDLSKLNKKICDNMETTDRFPEYKPHVTLAFVQKGAGDEFEGLTDFEGMEVSIDKAVFSGKEDSGKMEIKFNGQKTKSKPEENTVPQKKN